MVIPPCCLEWQGIPWGWSVSSQALPATTTTPLLSAPKTKNTGATALGPRRHFSSRVSKMRKQAKPGKLKFLRLSFFFSRVLTLWFDYGHWPDVNEALVEGVKAIQIDTWLQVRALGYR